MAENTENTQQSSGQLIPIISAVVLIAAVLVLFLLWQDSNSQLGELQDEATTVAEQAETSANRLLTATAVVGDTRAERDQAQAEATEAVGQASLNESLAATADSAREIAETAQADALSAQADAENAQATAQSAQADAESNSESAVATAEFAVAVQGTADSVAVAQVAEAENAQATAQSALNFQETAIAVAATTIAERDSAQTERDTAQTSLDAALDAQATTQAQADTAQSALDAIRSQQTMNAARLGLILSQLANAEARNAELEAENNLMATAIASGATLPPPQPTGTPLPPDVATPTPPPPLPDGTIGYTSDDGTYSFAYPDTVFFIADLGTDTVLANTAEASVELSDGVPPSTGNFWMYVTVFELGDVGDLGSFLSAAVAELRPDATQSAVVTDANTAYVDLIDENNRLLIIDLGNGLYGFLDIVANADEVDDFMSDIMIVAETLRVN